MPKKCVVLLSGGIDSATCLFLAKKEGFLPHCLFFDYGQRHLKEIKSARRIAASAGATLLISKIGFPWKGSSLLDSSVRIPARSKGIPSTYVPGRNIIFLSFALSCAESIKAGAIFIGANARDFSGYPDCRSDFYRAFRKVVSTGTKKRDIEIKTPLINKTKAQIVRLAAGLRVPFEMTWSCYRGNVKPCNSCDSCRFRAKGFKEAGIKDPLL